MKRMTRITRITRRLINPFRGKESGFGELTTVLVLLVVGGLILTPLLAFMVTGLKAGQAHEERTKEFYSADAGVEYAVYQLQYGGLITDNGTCNFTGTVTYSLHDLYGPMNGDNVTVSIENIGNQGVKFRVVSSATDLATGKTTTVKTYVVPKIRFPEPFFSNAITGLGDVTVKADIGGDIQCAGTLTIDSPGLVPTVDGDITCLNFNNKAKATINGSVTCGVIYDDNGNMTGGGFQNPNGGVINGDVRCRTFDNLGVVTGKVECLQVVNRGTVGSLSIVSPPPELPDLTTDWQTKDQLDILYGAQVPAGPPYYGGTGKSLTISSSATPLPAINMGYNPDPTKVALRSLIIQAGSLAAPVTLTGTVFVTGDFTVKPGSYVDMNGKTIYVWGDVDVQSGSYLLGSGAVIAVDQVNFAPNMVAGGQADQAVALHSQGVSGDWQVLDTGTLYHLNGVWGTSSTNVFAVGDGGTILHYNGVDDNADGNIWDPMTSPVRDNLNSVCGFSSDNVYAVGNGGTVIHYDGSAWGVVLDAPTSHSLHGVWCTSDNVLFAVGDGVILRYDGTWHDVTPVGCPNLNDVWGSSSTDMWAVGDYGRYVRNVTGAWGVRTAPVSVNVNLTGVWGSSADDVFIVGSGATILRHRNGGFTLMEIEAPFLRDLNDVWGTSSTNVYAVGDVSYILHYNGLGGWVMQNMLYEHSRDLNAVWGNSASDVFTVGKSEHDFVFVMSLSSPVAMWPQGDFFGAFTGKGTIELKPGSTLSAPAGIDQPNFPRFQFVQVDTYIIEQS